MPQVLTSNETKLAELADNESGVEGVPVAGLGVEGVEKVPVVYVLGTGV